MSQPNQYVRCCPSKSRIFGEYLLSLLAFLVVPALIWLFGLIELLSLSLLGCAAALTAYIGVLLIPSVRADVAWVEVGGGKLRAKRLYTMKVIERSIDDIEYLCSLSAAGRKNAELMDTPLAAMKAVEIRFREKQTPIRFLFSDPSVVNARQFFDALMYEMSRIGEIDWEATSAPGQSTLCTIHWKGEQPRLPWRRRQWRVYLGLLILCALSIGYCAAHWGSQQWDLYTVVSVPPDEMTLASLIQNGPRGNRHISITDFQRGGYAFRTTSGAWQKVWVAIFPAGEIEKDHEWIKAVLVSGDINGRKTLDRLLKEGKLTGVCSKSRRSKLEKGINDQLMEVNRGAAISSVWLIEYVSQRPSLPLIRLSLAASVFCFIAAWALSVLMMIWRE